MTTVLAVVYKLMEVVSRKIPVDMKQELGQAVG